ncbi:MAG TPA: pyroglutamyl-peptidase I [Calidithermus sp.]|nr:pyroglutamyl-peptidase I [Calidithermus sp.]
MREVVLLTGFEPFGGFVANPSQEVAEALDGRVVGRVAVRAGVLPVDHARAPAVVADLIDETDPAAVVHLGLAAGRARIALERVAVNVMDFDTPDNTGYTARGEPCVPGGPAAYFATLPLAVILERLRAEGIPAYLSNTAGAYLCNQTLYTTLHRLATRGHRARAGLVHLPLSPPMVAATGSDQPSMDLSLMVRAVEVVLAVVSAVVGGAGLEPATSAL